LPNGVGLTRLPCYKAGHGRHSMAQAAAAQASVQLGGLWALRSAPQNPLPEERARPVRGEAGVDVLAGDRALNFSVTAGGGAGRAKRYNGPSGLPARPIDGRRTRQPLHSLELAATRRGEASRGYACRPARRARPERRLIGVFSILEPSVTYSTCYDIAVHRFQLPLGRGAAGGCCRHVGIIFFASS
jgi:hypothetical protein